MELSTAYWASQALLTANRCGLFDILAHEPLDACGVAQRLEADERTTRLLLNALVGMELLDLRHGRYTNSVDSAAFLVADQPGYLGNAIRYADNLYGIWGQLQATVESGNPSLPAEQYTGGQEAPHARFRVWHA